MRIEPIRQEGYELLHEGALELARVEAAGIRVDISKLKATRDRLQSSSQVLKKELEGDKLWASWRRRFGAKANLGSRDQLGVMLFDVAGLKSKSVTESGKPSTEEEALQDLAEDLPFLDKYLRFFKYGKAAGTFLKGIEKEVIDGRLHPVFNLHTVRTYRSSSDSPNFQNFPVRDKEISEIIRSLFIPSEGCVLPENDFKGIEVNVSACYHEDPNFISYITTPGKDMHRDMAAQLFMLEPSQVSKDARYGAKNKFVFPQFYGDFYVSCARSLWDWIKKGKLTGPEGESLFDYLRRRGIKGLGHCDPEKDPLPGSFEKHVQATEDDFWNRRFKEYGRWRRRWYDAYVEKGYFDLKTGFRVYGSFRRNAVTNYPIQGSAFHCLLWSLIQINRYLRKYKMKSRVVGQIHDSMLGDVPVSELQNYLEIVERVTSVELRRHYTWITVPMEIEYEIAPENWFKKQEFKFKDGHFLNPSNPKQRTKDPFMFLRALAHQTK